jgi:hypothetical protein
MQQLTFLVLAMFGLTVVMTLGLAVPISLLSSASRGRRDSSWPISTCSLDVSRSYLLGIVCGLMRTCCFMMDSYLTRWSDAAGDEVSRILMPSVYRQQAYESEYVSNVTKGDP